MNIKEFDDVKPSFVLCFGALFAVILVTLIFYGLYLYLPLVLDPVQTSYRKLIHKSSPFREIYWLFFALERHRKRRSAARDLEQGFDKED